MDWFQSNISKVDVSDQNFVNICSNCIKNYKDDETIETIDLTEQSFTTNFSMSSNLPNINNKLVVETPVTIEAPVAIEVPITNTPDIFIICTLPKQWGKIELGHICYQISNTSTANHYDLKSDGAVKAFVAEIKHKKNLQLCVYQEPKNKNIHYEESNQPNKRIHTLETDSNTIATLNTIKKIFMIIFQLVQYIYKDV
ncbi:hypothetical protein F8M41_014426 [Gigaspora margarita]|uniref:Uncharacterized protein n=1 Tax=Gigaspora margarita TaxID=4874 RepID=A0A8H4ENN1_GIGMA|nr:hypothetical protein F8M41_014426 [Gigaspora margarita]